MKTFTIITINYNNCKGLKNTIESTISQSCNDYEYIIIDGGSTDESIDVINEYVSQIDYWVSEPDKGIYNAMNKGLCHATGKWVCFMNSGDCFADSLILEKISLFERNNNDIEIIYGNWQMISNNNSIIKYIAKPFFFNNNKILNGWGCRHQAMFVKTKIAQNLQFNESYKISADFDMIMKIYKLKNKNVFKYIDIIIATIQPDGISKLLIKDAFYESAIILNKYPSFEYYWCYFKKFYYFRLEWAVKSRLKKIFYSNKYDT